MNWHHYRIVMPDAGFSSNKGSYGLLKLEPFIFESQKKYGGGEALKYIMLLNFLMVFMRC